MDDLGDDAMPARVQHGARDAFRVLLVEDDEGDAILVGDLLQISAAVQVEWAASASEAERRLDEVVVDCVLLDLGLPDASGLEAIRRLLALDPGIALVVLTGDTDEQRGIDAMGAGAQDYLVKGRIDSGTLLRAIRYAVERKAAESSRQQLAVAHALAAENSRLHRGLLPDPIIEDPRIMVEAAYRPGQHRLLLGGDFYDVVQDGAGRVHAVVGDVCGHGPDEAALGVRMRMAWRTLVLAGAPEQELLGTLDRVLAHERERPGVFTSMVTLSVDPGCCAARVRLAGHPEPALIAGGSTRMLEECERGRVLGVDGPARWPATEIDLGDDWTLMLFTDGLYEGRVNGSSERLGTDGLLGLLAAYPTPPAENSHALEAMIKEVERLNGGALADDVAIVTLACDTGAG